MGGELGRGVGEEVNSHDGNYLYMYLYLNSTIRGGKCMNPTENIFIIT